MSEFRKCGIYPLNPGEISDRQLAPSHAFVRPASGSKLVSKLNLEQEKLYQKRHEEGYDLDDPKYSQWLKVKNLHASDEHSNKTSVSESAQKSLTPSVISTCAPDSDHASLRTSSSVSTSDVIGDLLTHPQPKITKKKENKKSI